MKLIVSGSRTITDYELVSVLIDNYAAKARELNERLIIIHGNALGVDECADRYAKEHGCGLIVMPALWKFHGIKAGILRNIDMAELVGATHCLCIWDGVSKGTKEMDKIARKRGLDTFLLAYNQWQNHPK